MVSDKLEWNLDEMIELVGQALKIEANLPTEDYAVQLITEDGQSIAEINPQYKESLVSGYHIQASYYSECPEASPDEINERGYYTGSSVDDWQGMGYYIEPGMPVWQSNQPTRLQALVLCLSQGFTRVGCTTSPF